MRQPGEIAKKIHHAKETGFKDDRKEKSDAQNIAFLPSHH
ncbi:Uncharacterised protein [Grimontia hollisae]|nr:Uncharacterised protein [Grimontia hollisae]STQ77098.1 Uncharacterised protein [Grimontia hollisae]